jgi:hypothetical protein
MKKAKSSTNPMKGWFPGKQLGRSKMYIYTRADGGTGIFICWPGAWIVDHRETIVDIMEAFNKLKWEWTSYTVRDFAVGMMRIYLN